MPNKNAGVVDVRVVDAAEFHAFAEWFQDYKAAADEALSAINELRTDDPWIARIQALALRALNIGAHEQPKPAPEQAEDKAQG